MSNFCFDVKSDQHKISNLTTYDCYITKFYLDQFDISPFEQISSTFIRFLKEKWISIKSHYFGHPSDWAQLSYEFLFSNDWIDCYITEFYLINFANFIKLGISLGKFACFVLGQGT